MVWTDQNLRLLDFDPEANQGDVVTVAVSTPAGVITIMAEIEIQGRLLVLKGAHMHGEAGANAIGVANLGALATFLLERIDCDEARVEGATRTTGARRGHQPRAFRFTRRPRDQA